MSSSTTQTSNLSQNKVDKAFEEFKYAYKEIKVNTKDKIVSIAFGRTVDEPRNYIAVFVALYDNVVVPQVVLLGKFRLNADKQVRALTDKLIHFLSGEGYRFECFADFWEMMDVWSKKGEA